MKIESESTMEFTVVLRMTEQEARALNAITVYGIKSFLEVFYKSLGKSYLEKHEEGCKKLFATVSKELPKHFNRIDATRKTFKGGVS